LCLMSTSSGLCLWLLGLCLWLVPTSSGLCGVSLWWCGDVWVHHGRIRHGLHGVVEWLSTEHLMRSRLHGLEWVKFLLYWQLTN
jgi:hypothetical protein